jgi:hypothetical protein
MRIGRTGKLLAILSVVALAVSVVGVTPSGATPAGMSAKQAGAVRATSDEVSARKRGHVRHYRSGNRAALQRSAPSPERSAASSRLTKRAAPTGTITTRTIATVTLRMAISPTAITAATATTDAGPHERQGPEAAASGLLWAY